MYSCLIGNGLSIAFSSDLSVPALTDWLASEFEGAGGELAALAQFARASGTPGETFEQLLGPLDRVARSLPHLEALLSVAEELDREDIRAALGELAKLARRVHDIGLGIVLGRVAEAGAAVDSQQFDDTVLVTCRAIKSLRGSPVTVATVNYDALLHAAFIRLDDGDPWFGVSREMADLGAGYAPAQCEPVSGVQEEALELRASVDLPGSRKIHLLNLHGSLSWLHDPRSGRMYKITALGRLRELDYWERLKKSEAVTRPLVVLTDQKDDVVSVAPFSVAYDAFRHRLVVDEKWLIAGYSFGDRPVNIALAEAIEAKRRNASRQGREPRLPRVLVIDKDCVETEKRRFVAQLLTLPEEHVVVDCQGLPEATVGEKWLTWSS